MATASNLLEALGLVAVVVGVYFFDWRAAVCGRCPGGGCRVRPRRCWSAAGCARLG